MRRITLGAALLGTLLAAWLTQAALRGLDEFGPVGVAITVLIAACIVALAIGLVVIDRRPPVRKAPRR